MFSSAILLLLVACLAAVAAIRPLAYQAPSIQMSSDKKGIMLQKLYPWINEVKELGGDDILVRMNGKWYKDRATYLNGESITGTAGRFCEAVRDEVVDCFDSIVYAESGEEVRLHHGTRLLMMTRIRVS
jgi:hypothetical protein